jgi:hypothetical protein
MADHMPKEVTVERVEKREHVFEESWEREGERK